MTRAHYYIEPDGDGWLIRVGAETFGPYRSALDALKTACVGAGGAHRAAPGGDGSDVTIWLNGVPKLAWTSDRDTVPLDYSGRLASL